MLRAPEGGSPSRRVRGAEEGSMLDRERPGRRIGARSQRRRSAGRHTAQRCGGVGRARHAGEEPAPSDVSRPPSQRRPARDGGVAEDGRRAHPPPHLGGRGLHQAPERESEADRGGAVHPATTHLARDDDHHRAAADAAVPARGDGHEPGRSLRTPGAAYLPLPSAVAVELDRPPHRAARSPAGRALGGASFDDRRRVPLPALDVEGALDDTRTASIPRHTNRSTTRRLSAKIRSPRRLFVAGTTPMLRPPRALLRHRGS